MQSSVLLVSNFHKYRRVHILLVLDQLSLLAAYCNISPLEIPSDLSQVKSAYFRSTTARSYLSFRGHLGWSRVTGQLPSQRANLRSTDQCFHNLHLPGILWCFLTPFDKSFKGPDSTIVTSYDDITSKIYLIID